ncbi:hypothetical protein L195_g001393 [Trifolium pratense]|uniref:Uncharacterized protein n=1 Tax=Trifolium pratense TaxID=57577 RepID=A0A2K3NPK4_TRIPR|nr:hypothetical protein L195_g001393 [Trifolium pratense]
MFSSLLLPSNPLPINSAFHPHISSQCSSGGGGTFPVMAAPTTNLIWGSWPHAPPRP